MVNTEPLNPSTGYGLYYNILNIVVNTEHVIPIFDQDLDYNILNIVVNTERISFTSHSI